MVMPRTTARDTVSAGGEETEEGRRATLVSSPLVASPELVDRPRRRRTFTAADKVRILAEIDRAGPGGSGAILRREGLYSSALTDCAANATSAPMRGHNKNCAQLYDV
jgi:transposase